MRPFELDEIDPKLCLFEFVYFARPDSQLYGRNVHQARVRMGERLAAQAPVEADMVMGVPESGLPAAEGYAKASGIPFGHGLVKNRYIGRTFIAPSPELRSIGVRMKLNPLRENIAGQRLVVIDDSIVRGTTTRGMIQMLRDAGAEEVHLRISSPPYRWPCFYGMDTGSRGELLAAQMSVEEIREHLGVDTIAYLTIDRLIDAVGAPGAGFCDACLTGEYPVAITPSAARGVLARRPHHARGRDGGGHDRSCERRRARGRAVRRSRGERAHGWVRPTRAPACPSPPARRRSSAIKADVRSTFRPEVVGDIGGFGGLFRFDPTRYRDPLLVSSTDGVGTKAQVATAVGRFDTIGIDLVAMCVDDLVCQGAEPLFFLDYISVGSLDPAQVSQLVAGVAEGCRQAGCALVGGEMAEHPGAMDPDEFDLVGFAVGVVERDALHHRGVGVAR